jgi:hypothetical protein
MGSTFATIRANFAWIFVYGPALSILPERWRGRRLSQKFALWTAATIISGVAEMFAGLNMIGLYFTFQVSPVLLWVAAYSLCDGAWRALNAKTHGESAGTVLFVFADQAIYSMRQTVCKLAHPIVSDLVTLDDLREDWQLKIEAARLKRHWETGKLVHFNEQRYFRIESSIQMGGPRPFVYLLRSLPAGVPGHGVLKYNPVQSSQKSS